MPESHVLLVDDDLAVLRVLDRALTRCGFRVSVAADAATACAIVACDPVDVLVLDYRLPMARGDALLERLAALDPTLPSRAIFMTGDVTPAADEALVATGCPRLAKPFSLDELARHVDAALTGARVHASVVSAA